MYSSLNILDSILRLLAMTNLDANDPTAPTFARNAVPVVEVSSEEYISTSKCYTQQQQSLSDAISESRCPCDKLSLGSQWPEAYQQVPNWASTPMWNREWTEGEIKKEECRRVCWSSLMLVSGQSSFADAVNWKLQDLFIAEPSNVGAILKLINTQASAAHPTCSIPFYFRGDHSSHRIRGLIAIS